MTTPLSGVNAPQHSSRLWFCLGTAGELIKIFPLFKEADDRKIDWFCLSTGQSAINLKKQWNDFRLPADKLIVLNPTQHDLQTSTQALRWFTQANLLTRKQLRTRIAQGTRGIMPQPQDFWIIHGDTLSSLVGCRYGRKLGIPVGHVEAGLRSPMLFEPFPEEITRRAVSKRVQFHFAQDSVAEKNLITAHVSGKIISTQANTLLDALRRILAQNPKPSMSDSPPPYVVANLHRYENLGSSTRWRQMVDVLVNIGKKGYPVHFVLHAPTQAKLASDPENRKRLEENGVLLVPRMPFSQFVPLLDGAEFVVSDGGSNQEECFYLGKPCLILRDSTERQEGLENGPCVLSRFDPSIIETFLAQPNAYRRPAWDSRISPSSIILNQLTESTL